MDAVGAGRAFAIRDVVTGAETVTIMARKIFGDWPVAHLPSPFLYQLPDETLRGDTSSRNALAAIG